MTDLCVVSCKFLDLIAFLLLPLLTMDDLLSFVTYFSEMNFPAVGCLSSGHFNFDLTELVVFSCFHLVVSEEILIFSKIKKILSCNFKKNPLSLMDFSFHIKSLVILVCLFACFYFFHLWCESTSPLLCSLSSKSLFRHLLMNEQFYFVFELLALSFTVLLSLRWCKC